MRKRDLIIYSLLFALSVAITATIVVTELTGKSILSLNDGVHVPTNSIRCSNGDYTSRPSTNDPQLAALTEYESACNSMAFGHMMIFTNMPVSEANAVMLADSLTIRLREFSKFNIKPIVVIEPDSEWGLIDFNEYANGEFDQWIEPYFKRLKENGVKDHELGIWLPFPEPQQPVWNNNDDPNDFARSVNRHLSQLRTHFPNAETAILLDSQVGEFDGTSQLLAYTRILQPELVDIVGLQGFPWHTFDETDERDNVTSASIFAPAYVLEEVARSLGTKEVLLNTGTYRRRRSNEGGEFAISVEERQRTLDSINYEVELLVNTGYNVLVNIFAENKLDDTEGVDWSYWRPGVYGSSSHAPLFTNFARELNQTGADISIFDSRSILATPEPVQE